MGFIMERKTTEFERDPRWNSVVRRDAAADGTFVYAVTTTGVYCRPSCPSRTGQAGERHASTRRSAEAEAAGYRACQRCSPERAVACGAECRRCREACRLIEEAEELPKLDELAAAVGMSPLLLPSSVQGDHRTDAESLWRRRTAPRRSARSSADKETA